MWKRASTLSVLLCMSALGACASNAASSGQSAGAFTAQDAQLFEDGADFLADPDALEGKWGVDWDTEMRGRVASSDVIAIVTVTTLRTDVDPQGRTTYRVAASPTHVWKGNAPSDGFSLSSSEGSVGFPSLDREKQRMLNQTFIAFVKWYQTPEGATEAHWHLSVAADRVLARVRTYTESATPSHKTVIETHTTTE